MEVALSMVAIGISIISTVVTLVTFRWTALRDRRQSTLDAYNRLQEQVLDYINGYTVSEIKEILKDSKSEEYKKLGFYLARTEHFCVGVNQKIYSKDTVYELSHGYFDGYLKRRIEPIIEARNWGGNDYYSNIHRMFAWMESKQNKKSLGLKWRMK